MEKKRFWRSLFVFLMVGLSVLYIMPTLAPESMPKWFPFKKQLNFGLDL